MENQEKTKRQLWEEGIRAKNPDIDFDNDEDALFGAAMQGYDAEHEYRKKNEAGNKRMYELLSANPDVSMFMSSLVSDGNVGKAMSYLSDALSLQEGTPEYDEYQKGVSERKQREAEQAKAIEEYEKNLHESAGALKDFADENGMSEEEAIEFVRQITSVINDKLFAGKIDKEFLDLFFRAFNYDKDLQASREAGVIDGRNEQIDAKNHKLKKGDGLPNVATAAGKTEPTVREDDSTMQALRGMAERADKRNKMFG